MAGDLPLDAAHLMGFPVGMLMYGWYFAMLTRAIPGLWARRRRSRVMIWVTTCIFFVTTLNLILCAVDEYNTFINHREGPGVIVYLSKRTFVKIRPVSTLLLCEAGILADILVVWRLYAIWNKSTLVTIFPATLLVVDFGIGIAICVMAITTGGTYRGEAKAPLILSILIAADSLLLNIYSTAMIIARLWWVARRAKSSHGRGLYKAVIVSLVESGSLYTVTVALYSVLLIVHYTGTGEFFMYILMMVIAISPLLIVLHLSATFSTPPDNSHSTSARSEVAVPVPRVVCPPAARVTFSPIDSYQLKTWRASSHPTDKDESQAGLSASTSARKVSITVPSLSSAETEMRLRLEEDQDMAKVDVEEHVEKEDEEAGMPRPSPHFAPCLDYISRSSAEV